MPVRIDPGQRPGTTRTLLGQDDGGLVRRTVLPGGLRVVTEHVPGVRSATLGVWVGVGSRDESARQAGASHFLEHLLFKGTRTRSAMDISAALDAVGGELNAFTSKEYTCFHARVLDDDLPLAVDVVADMVLDPVLAADDVESEREVILEEIAMNDDDPDDVVHNLVLEQAWGSGTPLGRPVAGVRDDILGLGRETIRRFHRSRYVAGSIVVAAAGNVDHGRFVRRVRRAFAGLVSDDGARPHGPREPGRAPRFRPGVSVERRSTEQANVVIGVPGTRRGDPSRYASSVLNAALGGGMSSRLFQEVRERRGLAYSVYSFAQGYADTGMVGVYVGCAPRRVEEALKVCRNELLAVAEHGLTDAEVALGRGQMRGSVVLGLEDPASRMSRVAKADLLHGELSSVDEVLARVDAVTPDDVRTAAAVLAEAPAVAVVGPFDDTDRFSALL